MSRRGWARYRAWLIGVGLLLLVGPSGLAAQAQRRTSDADCEARLAQRLKEIDKALEAHFASKAEAGRMVGMSVSIACGPAHVHTLVYGNAQASPRVPLTARTLFRLGSLTKTAVAATVLSLARDRMLQLDDPAAAHLPSLQHLPPSVSVRQLLNHTSGLPTYMLTQGGIGELAFATFSSRQLVEAVLAGAPSGPAGERFRYNNANYLLLGLLIEHTVGHPWPQVVDTRVMRPVGLRFEPCGNDRLSGEAVGYLPGPQGGAPRIAALEDLHLLGGAGDWCGTSALVATWLAHLMAGDVLPPESLAHMMEPASLNDGSTHAYGFGLSLGTELGKEYVSHAGTVMGFRTSAYHWKADGLTVVVSTNMSGSDTGGAQEIIAKALLLN